MHTYIIEYKKGDSVISLLISDYRLLSELSDELEGNFSKMATFIVYSGLNVLIRWDSIIAIYEYLVDTNNNSEVKK